MKRFLNWLADRISPEEAPPVSPRSRPGAAPGPVRKPIRTVQEKAANSDFVEFDATLDGTIDSAGPGKNVLRRPKFVREETGTHDTLSIIDDSGYDQTANDEEGIDPYNTGKFDRSRNWDQRFRKD